VTRSYIAKLTAVLGIGAACLLPAGGAAADTGTGGALAGGDPAGGQGATAPGGLASRHAALLGRTVHFRGSLGSDAAGRSVEIDRLDRTGTWVPTATTVADAAGGFTATWRTDHIGHFPLRAVLAGVEPSAGAHAAGAPVTGDVTVYRPVTATLFGPGLYGRHTACGQRLTHRLVGVASPSLPCGTRVALLYGGRTITVPVVDRGPFAPGVSYDLTTATAQALGVDSTQTVGAVALRGGA
jgi:rare lipoprotein A